MITLERCSACPGVHHCLPPDGPEDADILFIGEAPGKQEEAKGRVFIGRTGEEVDGHYLPLAGLRRSEVCITNAISCLPATSGGKLDSKRRKDTDLLDCCATARLYPLIEKTTPRLLVPMGAFACRAVCPEVDLELHHGIPQQTAWGIPAYPMYHPALGIYEPKKMLAIRTDWHRLKSYLSGRLKLPVDTLTPDYREVTDVKELEELDPTLPLGGDTESTRKHEPFCVTYSQKAGTGRLIRANRGDLLEALSHHLDKWRAPILFHNWLYDWPVTSHMGLRIPHRLVIDTMARSFHLGNLPQGLKALAFRELGMVMQDFDDLVTPYSTEMVLDYYRAAQTIDWPKPPEELVQDETGAWKMYKPQSMSTKLKRFFTDYSKNPDKDVFGMWDKWDAPALEQVCGPYPGRCISHVPFEKVIHYACRDADALVRLYPILQRMVSQVRKKSQELWRQ